jgi:hypothetical protein
MFRVPISWRVPSSSFTFVYYITSHRQEAQRRAQDLESKLRQTSVELEGKLSDAHAELKLRLFETQRLQVRP